MSTKVGKVVGGAHTWHMGKINVKNHFPSTLKLHAGRGVKGGGVRFETCISRPAHVPDDLECLLSI